MRAASLDAMGLGEDNIFSSFLAGYSALSCLVPSIASLLLVVSSSIRFKARQPILSKSPTFRLGGQIKFGIIYIHMLIPKLEQTPFLYRESPYGNLLSPCPFLYGDHHMETVIPLWKIFPYGDFYLNPQIGTNSICIQVSD